jgi:hypothetical protein
MALWRDRTSEKKRFDIFLAGLVPVGTFTRHVVMVAGWFIFAPKIP